MPALAGSSSSCHTCRSFCCATVAQIRIVDNDASTPDEPRQIDVPISFKLCISVYALRTSFVVGIHMYWYTYMPIDDLDFPIVYIIVARRYKINGLVGDSARF